LADHSLLARAPERWWMLEMIREFALAQMSSEKRAAVQQRHTAYFATQAATQTVTNFDAIARDYDNFRTALAWAIAAHDAHAALTLCIKLCWFWETRGYMREGMSLARAALATSGVVDGRLRVDALERVSTLAWLGHQFDVALDYAEQAIALARSRGRHEDLAFVLNLLGRIFIEQGDYARAEVALQESLQHARQAPHLFNPGCPLTQLGDLALARGDWEAAQTHLTQAVTLLAGEGEGGQGGIHIHLGVAHTALAEVALVQNQYAQARHELWQVLPYAHLRMRRLRAMLVTLAGLLLATLHTTQAEDARAAAAFLGAVAGMGERTGDSLPPWQQALAAQRSASAQRLLAQHEWQAAWQVGYTWTPAQAVAEAEKWLEME
jgi:tetratricopeptide (TPR) repeat protein